MLGGRLDAGLVAPAWSHTHTFQTPACRLNLAALVSALCPNIAQTAPIQPPLPAHLEGPCCVGCHGARVLDALSLIQHHPAVVGGRKWHNSGGKGCNEQNLAGLWHEQRFCCCFCAISASSRCCPWPPPLLPVPEDFKQGAGTWRLAAACRRRRLAAAGGHFLAFGACAPLLCLLRCQLFVI